MDTFPETASQTAGPYVHIGCTPNFAGLKRIYDTDLGGQMVGPEAEGTPITLTGRIFDGDGAPLRDALVEAWQADAAGRFASHPKADPQVAGFGRCACDAEDGTFRFETIKPGSTPWPAGGLQAPHVTLWIVARGINTGLQTRVYFADEETANTVDPVLSLIEVARRGTLLARPQGSGEYLIDIHLQGPDETVFFAI